MTNEECYYCGCCECDGYCKILNKYINEIEECTVSNEEKCEYSCWNLYKDKGEDI